MREVSGTKKQGSLIACMLDQKLMLSWWQNGTVMRKNHRSSIVVFGVKRKRRMRDKFCE
jgi:hypothetical protein